MTRASVVVALLVVALVAVSGGAWASGTGAGTSASTGAGTGTSASAGAGTGTVDDGARGALEIDVSKAEVKVPARGGLWDVLGRLHPLLVHIPIGWLILLALVDLGGLAIGYESLEHAGRWLSIIAAFSCLPALLTGFARADGAAKVAAAMLAHRNLMIGCSVLVSTAAALRWLCLRRQRFTRVMRAAYALLVGLAVALLVVGAHLGATMVYGDSYLF